MFIIIIELSGTLAYSSWENEISNSNSEMLAFLSKFKVFPSQSNPNLFIFLKMMSLHNKDLLIKYTDNLNPNNFSEFNSQLSDYTNLNNDRLLQNIKKVLNYIVERINSINQSIVFHNLDEQEDSAEEMTVEEKEEKLETVKYLKEFMQKNTIEIKAIKNYL